jgi:phospholipid/cholesterol/gamma-HCH transport system ATP-binding protein
VIAVPLEFRAIRKSFGDRVVLDGVDLRIEDGECFFVIGASGVGKSVLIKHAVGLLRPDSGEILLDGREVSRLSEHELMSVRKTCAMVFQSSTLFDSLTCAQNVALPLRKHGGLSEAEALADARSRLAAAGLGDLCDLLPSQIGEGSKKRVAIVRALTLRPRYVLFDEPTTSLDPVSARRVDRSIRSLCDEHGVTSVVVSHDLESIFTIADRIAMLYKGRVRLLGTPEDFRRTDDAVVRQFVAGAARGPMEV